MRRRISCFQSDSAEGPALGTVSLLKRRDGDRAHRFPFCHLSAEVDFCGSVAAFARLPSADELFSSSDEACSNCSSTANGHSSSVLPLSQLPPSTSPTPFSPSAEAGPCNYELFSSSDEACSHCSSTEFAPRIEGRGLRRHPVGSQRDLSPTMTVSAYDRLGEDAARSLP